MRHDRGMDWHQPQALDAREDESKLQNPLLAAFQYKTPVSKVLPSRRHGSGSAVLLEKIHGLSDSLRTDLAPRYDQLESQLDRSVNQVRQKVDQLGELQNEVRAKVESFATKVRESHSELDGNLSKLQNWLDKPRDVKLLGERLNTARAELDQHSRRLEHLATEIAEEVEEVRKRNLNASHLRTATAAALIAVALIVLWRLLARQSSAGE